MPRPKKKIFTRPIYREPEALPANVISWFEKRGIPPEVLQAEKISYGPSFGPEKHGVRFPYLKGGVVVNVKHRSGSKDFRQEKDAEKCLYRFDSISQGGDTLIISEGEMDALSWVAVGFDKATSVPDGAPNPEAQNFASKFDYLESAEKVLESFRRIIIAVDNDPPGRRLEEELSRRIGIERCWRVEYPEGCKDANDVLVKHGADVLRKVIEDARPFPVEGLLTVEDLEAELLTLYEKGPNRGESTGWPILDEYYRIRPGELTIITGIPGSGKSNFLDAMLINLASEQGWPFAVFSPENWPPSRHLKGLVEKVARKPFSQHGQFSDRMSPKEVMDTAESLREFFFFIMPQEEILSVDSILEKAKVAIYRHGVKGLVLDPWNEVEHLFGNLSETQYISKELAKIRRFARMNQVHVWIVAHPRNLIKDPTGGYKPPTMYEISGGANWRNKADNGLCIHRPDFQNDITEVYIQKIRFREVGKLGKIDLRFCKDTGNYFEEGSVER